MFKLIKWSPYETHYGYQFELLEGHVDQKGFFPRPLAVVESSNPNLVTLV